MDIYKDLSILHGISEERWVAPLGDTLEIRLSFINLIFSSCLKLMPLSLMLVRSETLWILRLSLFMKLLCIQGRFGFSLLNFVFLSTL